MRKPFIDPDEDDSPPNMGIPAEAAGVALHSSMRKKKKRDDDEDESSEPDLDEDDLEALGG